MTTHTLHAGDVASRTAQFRCAECDEEIQVEKGQEIPECSCGCTEFEEMESKSQSQSGTTGQQGKQSGGTGQSKGWNK